MRPQEFRTSAGAAGRFLAAYGVLPNVAFAVAGHWLYLVRPLINFDYLLIGVLHPWIGRRAARLLIGAALANDLVINAAPACQFALPEFLRALGQLDVLEPRFLILLGIVLALVSSLGAIAMVHLGGRDPPRVVVAGIVGLGLIGGVAQLRGEAAPCLPACAWGSSCRDGACVLPDDIPVGVVNLGLLTTVEALRERGQPPPPAPVPERAVVSTAPPTVRAGGDTPPVAPEPSPVAPPVAAVSAPRVADEGRPRVRSSASAPLLAAVHDPASVLPRRNQVLVLVESMGEFRDPEAAAQLLLPLTQLSSRYTVEVGLVPFHGPTISGEFRELCGAHFQLPIDVISESKRPFPECLPARMVRRGYHTVAFHGFSRSMYSRSDWYPRVGFQRMVFEQDLIADGIDRQCGNGYRGNCDADVAQRLDQELQKTAQGPPLFAYWMTLNSHLPTRNFLEAPSTFECRQSLATRDSAMLCGHAHALSIALEAVARVASDPQLPPTDFIVVGDHAPPYPVRSDRDAFDPGRVPYVILSWRDQKD